MKPACLRFSPFRSIENADLDIRSCDSIAKFDETSIYLPGFLQAWPSKQEGKNKSVKIGFDNRKSLLKKPICSLTSTNISCSSTILFSNFLISACRASISANVCLICAESVTIYFWVDRQSGSERRKGGEETKREVEKKDETDKKE